MRIKFKLETRSKTSNRVSRYRGKIDRFRSTRILDPPLLLSPRCVTLTQRHGLFRRVYKCKQRGNGDLHNDMHYATINMRVAGSGARNVTHGRTFRNFGVSSSCGMICCVHHLHASRPRPPSAVHEIYELPRNAPHINKLGPLFTDDRDNVSEPTGQRANRD